MSKEIFASNLRVVIPYIQSGIELKYSIRSIEKHYPGSEVVIIGDKPQGFNIWHIPAKDTPGLIFKERNIFNKALIAADLFHDFLFMNDDHFLLEPIEENYFEGTLKEWFYRSEPNSYQQTLKNTFTAIGDTPYFDIHCPLKMESRIVKCLSNYDWDKEFGYCFKTLYAYAFQQSSQIKLRGKEYPDLKFREPMTKENIKSLIRDRKFFSTGNRGMNNDMIEVLEELYPNKSKYER